MMSGWTLFFTMIGLAAALAQLFRLVDIIEYPQRHPVWMAVWESRPQVDWKILLFRLWRKIVWMFWKS